MKASHRTILLLGLVFILLLIGLYSALPQDVTLVIDGTPITTRTSARTVTGVLQAAQITVGPADWLEPPADQRFLFPPTIQLERASQITIWDGGEAHTLLSLQPQVSGLLEEAGLHLDVGDRILSNGQPIDLEYHLSPASNHTLQIRRGVQVTLEQEGVIQVISSTAPTLGQALWEAGVKVGPGDLLEPDPDTPLDRPIEAKLTHASPVVVSDQGSRIRLRTAAQTVGETLTEAGLGLQGLDYSQPPEDSPLPASGRIQIFRVRESLQLAYESLPFETEYQLDPETELDHESVIDPGQAGLVVSRVRMLSVDGQEVSQTEPETWTAQEPQTRQVGQGTQVVVRTLEVGGKTIEYWRKVTMYATSYSPCRLGTGTCDDVTASGAKLRHGIAAVTPRWFRDMRYQQVYVQGYGTATIADTGGGIPGRYWIDLGYSDDNYVSWHQWVTVYFLTPVPPLIPYILYP